MTATEMEERVARAICVADEVLPEKECYGMGVQKPKDWIGPAWEARLNQARAAIRAMREPTQGLPHMENAACVHLWYGMTAEQVAALMVSAASPGDAK